MLFLDRMTHVKSELLQSSRMIRAQVPLVAIIGILRATKAAPTTKTKIFTTAVCATTKCPHSQSQKATWWNSTMDTAFMEESRLSKVAIKTIVKSWNASLLSTTIEPHLSSSSVSHRALLSPAGKVSHRQSRWMLSITQVLLMKTSQTLNGKRLIG